MIQESSRLVRILVRIGITDGNLRYPDGTFTASEVKTLLRFPDNANVKEVACAAAGERKLES